MSTRSSDGHLQPRPAIRRNDSPRRTTLAPALAVSLAAMAATSVRPLRLARALTLGLAVTVAPWACHKGEAPPAEDGQEEQVKLPPPDLDSSVHAAGARASDPRWARAREGDPIDLAALADAEGAVGLLAGMQDGGDTARAALLALPLAPDAEIALGRLGDVVRDVARKHLDLVLAAVLAVAERPPQQREALDRRGARRCADALGKVAGDAAIAGRSRATAASALRLLVDRGLAPPDAAALPPAP